MKKALRKVSGAIKAFFTILASSIMVTRTRLVLANKRAEGSVSHAISILIAVIIGALLLAGLYMLFGDVIMPKVEEKIREMFNYGASL